jgi:hypothetical protein
MVRDGNASLQSKSNVGQRTVSGLPRYSQAIGPLDL